MLRVGNIFNIVTRGLKSCTQTRIFHSNPIKTNGVKLFATVTDTIGDTFTKSETTSFIQNLAQRFHRSPVKIKADGFDDIYTKFVGSRVGTNPAFWAQNTRTGELFYVKSGSVFGDTKHLESEFLANKLYNLAGIKTPEVRLATLEDGSTCLMSKFSNGLKEMNKAEAQEAFAVDAWLGNWDSLLSGNTFSQGGKCIKMDCGGALRYRALGKLKPNFGNEVEELSTMLNSAINPTASSIYSGMSKDTLIKSLERVTTISDDAIKKLVKDETLATTLINRKKYMRLVLAELRLHRFDALNSIEVETLDDIVKTIKPLAQHLELINDMPSEIFIQNMINQRKGMTNPFPGFFGKIDLELCLEGIKGAGRFGRNTGITARLALGRGADKSSIFCCAAKIKRYDIEDIRALDAVIKQGSLPQNTTLYRGASPIDFGLYEMNDDSTSFIDKFFKKNRLFRIPIFPETSLKYEIAHKFASSCPKQRRLLYKINAPKGTPAVYLERFPNASSYSWGNEEEVMLARDLVYRFKNHIPTENYDILEVDIVKRPPFWQKIHEFWKEL